MIILHSARVPKYVFSPEFNPICIEMYHRTARFKPGCSCIPHTASANSSLMIAKMLEITHVIFNAIKYTFKNRLSIAACHRNRCKAIAKTIEVEIVELATKIKQQTYR